MPSVLSDNDPSIQFDKPLVVLVNSFSASASEIFAAAMQDYKRAVIIGSTSTYGKGTVQRFVDLDEYLAMADDTLKPLGSLKLTIQKFYRINGGSTQLKGVTPDIILPDVYNYLKVGESEMDYPMQWSQVNAVNYNVWNSTINFSDIKQKSKARTDKSEVMNLINESSLRLEKLDKEKTVTLNLTKYRKEQLKLNEESKKYENIEKEIPQLVAITLKSDDEEMKSDTVKQSRAKTWLKDIKKDAYIYEAVKVIEDLK
jgi:carboxyl-terminal processing protease